MFYLNQFISQYVTKRENSLFEQDILNNKDILKAKIQGKTFLVIGGAGSIGSSFIKAVLNFKPASLVVVDTNENALTELTRDLRCTKGMDMPEEYLTYPMDYSSKAFERMFRTHRGFDVVSNFSAHKHVRSEKDVFSTEALIRNNVINAKGLLELLVEYPPEEYFCVSTDKAANPVNIMGASKRIMEDLIFSYSDFFNVKTARFANVAFSNGSLPLGFLERINKLQPISAPSDVRRYFVSLEESGQICMLACMLGKNREIFFPLLAKEQMITFDQIALDLLKECGYSPLYCQSDEEAIDEAQKLWQGSKAYPVRFTNSNTSGEKAYEEFYTKDEIIDINRFNSMGVIVDKKICKNDKINQLLFELSEAFENDNNDKEIVVRIISSYLGNFVHYETGRSLDERM